MNGLFNILRISTSHDLIYGRGLAILAGTSLGLNRWIHNQSAGV